jgi:hypothetical protein
MIWWVFIGEVVAVDEMCLGRKEGAFQLWPVGQIL